MIARLPSAINFFKLLAARPALVELLSEILSHAPTLADALARFGREALATWQEAQELRRQMSGGAEE